VHKLESRSGPLQLSMEQTPKVLVALRHKAPAGGTDVDAAAGTASSSSTVAPAPAWFPHGFAVSFKLETDVGVLVRKARAALLGYRVNVVVANELHSRYKQVQLISRNDVGSGGAKEEQQRQQQGETADAPSDIAVAVLRRASAGEQGTASSSPLEFDVEVEVALVRALVREHDRWIAQA